MYAIDPDPGTPDPQIHFENWVGANLEDRLYDVKYDLRQTYPAAAVAIEMIQKDKGLFMDFINDPRIIEWIEGMIEADYEP